MEFDKILSVGIVMRKNVHIYNRVMALDSSQSLFPFNIFRIKGCNLARFCIHSDNNKI